MNSVTVQAAAKLNLFLHIVGKRADGYHLLESLVAFTDMCDAIEISAAETLHLNMDGEFVPDAGAGDGNLVLKAARLLQEKTSTNHGAALRLTKNIPVGAGLGGGSADAAATLRGLNDFWQLHVPMPTLQQWATQLGADVPMCLASTAAMARGIGDELTPISALPQMHGVLVHPRVPLLTAQVYEAYRHQSRPVWGAVGNDCDALTLPELLAMLKTTRNDLQLPAIGISPLIAEVLLALETLLPMPLLVRMTGSGACCFALYEHAEEAARASTHLKTEYPLWWVQQALIG